MQFWVWEISNYTKHKRKCCWFSSLLRGFFSGLSGFPLYTKINISKFQLDREFEDQAGFVNRRLLCVTLVKQSWFIYFYVSCLNLYLKFSPPSAMMCCSPPFKPDTNLFKWLTSSTFHNSSSVYLSNGSKFRRRVPENSTGSCTKKTFNDRINRRSFMNSLVLLFNNRPRIDRHTKFNNGDLSQRSYCFVDLLNFHSLR